MLQKNIFKFCIGSRYHIKAIEICVPKFCWFWRATYGPKKIFFFQKLFPPSFSSKNLSFEKFSTKFSNIFFPTLQLTKKYKNSWLKNHHYGNASREKTVTAVWQKISEVKEKSLSEILKKTADQKQVWFQSYNESKKRIFPRRHANLVAPTVYIWIRTN